MLIFSEILWKFEFITQNLLSITILIHENVGIDNYPSYNSIIFYDTS